MPDLSLVNVYEWMILGVCEPFKSLLEEVYGSALWSLGWMVSVLILVCLVHSCEIALGSTVPYQQCTGALGWALAFLSSSCPPHCELDRCMVGKLFVCNPITCLWQSGLGWFPPGLVGQEWLGGENSNEEMFGFLLTPTSELPRGPVAMFFKQSLHSKVLPLVTSLGGYSFSKKVYFPLLD